jgi:hypothetical protein
MKHKFGIGDRLKIKSEPGYTGKVLLIRLYGLNGEPEYLLDCHPGALAYYDYYVHPEGYGLEKIIAANWVTESDLELCNV